MSSICFLFICSLSDAVQCDVYINIFKVHYLSGLPVLFVNSYMQYIVLTCWCHAVSDLRYISIL